MTETKPVKISGAAMSALSYLARSWSGWGNKATLVLGATEHSPFAECLHDPHFRITLNPETLLLNPNRVLNTVTPFRLRQEAILTGALLHEAGHARHSHWQPGRYGNPVQAVHGDGTPVRPLVLEFAKVIEEARIEGLIAAEAADIGARGLAWTMRCSAIKVLPLTEVNVDPDQAVMDVMCSWILRAGRQVATLHHLGQRGVNYTVPNWVSDFNTLLGSVVSKHIVANKMKGDDLDPFDEPSSDPEQTEVMGLLLEAVCAGTDSDQPGSTAQVDIAERILNILFPPEKQDDLDTQGGCPEDAEQEDPQEGQSGDESDEQDSDGTDPQDEESDAGDGDSEDEADDEDTGGESDEDGEDGEGDTEPEDEGEGSDPGEGDAGDDEDGEPTEDDGSISDKVRESDQAALQEKLTEVEQAASKQAEEEKAAECKNPSEQMIDGESEAQNNGDPDGATGGRGEGRQVLDYRHPDAGEREVKKGAVEFLRKIIDPSESGKYQITDSPSATVDGAALAAWKAGGQKSDPRFFRRIKRTDQPAPPVKIAILVDVSASMDVLQAPSALLSWAMASACLDLRNFAGRGVQVESTLIHWGSSARVIQANGATMPGIHTDPCMESTVAMDRALDLVEEQLPGFFDPAENNENRLLVQFTDWELSAYHGSLETVCERIDQAFSVGVNMLSVVPMDYSWRRTKLDDVMRHVRNPVGRNALLKYNPDKPHEVWAAATEVLSGTATNYGF